MHMREYPEIGIYIHIPFCIKKCGYCDFLSAPSGKETQREYVTALLKELELYQEKLQDYKIRTLYIGGGTPSVLESIEMERILESIRKLGKNQELFTQDKRKEFWEEATIELNPGTITGAKLKSYKKCGINRLSIGLQSTDNEELKLLGRIHTFEEFLENYQLARKIGFENISVDLMSAIPNQTLGSWETSLYRIMELQPEHISAYSLIVEEHTLFEKLYGEQGTKKNLIPSEELERKMYKNTKEILEKEEYHRYEISNYAKKGKESKHNSSYWKRMDYIGMGLGASSCFQNERYKNEECLQQYIKKVENGIDLKKEKEQLSRQSRMEEFMFLGLRMMEGISKSAFQKEFLITIEEVYGRIIQKFVKQGLLVEKEDKVMLTEKGIDVSNRVFLEFLFD